MLVFLIIVSLILNIAALLAIAILFLRQNRLSKIDENQKKMMIEMDHLISSYLLEMKEDNEHFIQRVKEIQKEKQVSANAPTIPDGHSMGQDRIENEQQGEIKRPTAEANPFSELSSKLEKMAGLQAVKAYQRSSQRQSETIATISSAESQKQRNAMIDLKSAAIKQVEKKTSGNSATKDSLLTQVMIMKKEGISEEEMARQLKKGKTEIELLLKFNENQQE
nr:hypothetical protein [uncultured Bacillus sp.]